MTDMDARTRGHGLKIASIEAGLCRCCPRSRDRNCAVFGSRHINGDDVADLADTETFASALFICDQPTVEDESDDLLPVGFGIKTPRGKALAKICAAMGLGAEDYYATTALKCRSRKKPCAEDIDECKAFVKLQIHHIKPKIVVAFGDIALRSLDFVGLDYCFGEITSYQLSGTTYPVMPTREIDAIISDKKARDEAAKHLFTAMKVLKESHA